MPTFFNLKDLYSYAIKSTIERADYILEDIAEILRNFTEENIYKRYIPSEYDRTYEFINSITIKKFKKIEKNLYHAKVFYDESKIVAKESDIFWNFHMSIDGIDVSGSLPFYLEYGTKGSLWDRPAGNMVKDSKEYIERTRRLNVLLRKTLILKGFKVKYIR